jgi:thermostable 8-oxoguanine DNA glycosylase
VILDKATGGLTFEYFEEGKAALKKRLEDNSEMWDRWTKSDKRYMLVYHLLIVDNDVEKGSGPVTAHLDCHIGSNNLEDLRLMWNSKFVQQRYDSTRQHFIVDTKDKKVVEFLSVCM